MGDTKRAFLDPDTARTMTRALYDSIGVGYAGPRRQDPRIGGRIAAALAGCDRVVNVGAGAGSYEPVGVRLVAVEPSAEMIRQRAPAAAPAVRAVAGRLPFADRSFDGALAILTLHHWPSPEAGLAELRRVARERVVLLTWDPHHPGFWLVQDYFPEILETDRRIFPSLECIAAVLGPVESHVVPVPADCSDGFLGAYWRRPAEYLDPGRRAAISTFTKIDAADGLERLRRDLEDGSFYERHGALADRAELDLGYRLVVART